MTFSILYRGSDLDSDNLYAVDWGWETPGVWARSEREGVRWYVISGLDDRAYKALIDAFGLHEKQVGIEKIIVMSPRELTRIGTKDPISDTVGGHRKASEVED